MDNEDLHFRRNRDLEREEIDELKEIEKDQKEEIKELKEIVTLLKPVLSFVKIAFQQGGTVAEGPVTMTVGQKTVASLDGFDQNGAPMPAGFVMPAISWSIDNATLDSSTPDTTNNVDNVVSLAAGTANLTASVTSAEGKALTDTETITNVAQPPVLSSVKINFSTPA